MAPLTANTITDGQIRALGWEAHDAGNWELHSLAVRANVLPDGTERRALRARCAKILNARAATDAERGMGEPFTRAAQGGK